MTYEIRRHVCRGSREIFGREFLELLLDQIEDATVFIREIRQRAEAGHPWWIGSAGMVRARTPPELLFERFGEKAPQSDATGSGERLGLPEQGIGKLNRRFHVPIFP